MNREMKTVIKIRDNYVAKETTKIDELKMLDKRVRKPVTVFSCVFGIIGSLVLGTGMCFAMKVIGDLMILGIAIGLVGILMVSTTYFIHNGIMASRKRKYADKIIELSDSIINNKVIQ